MTPIRNFYFIVLAMQTGKVGRLCSLVGCCLSLLFTEFSAWILNFVCLCEFSDGGRGSVLMR